MAEVVNEILAARGQTLAIAETSSRGEGAQALGGAPLGQVAFAGGALLASDDALRATLGDRAAAAEAMTLSQDLADRLAQAMRQAQGSAYALAIVGPFDAAAHEGELAYFGLAFFRYRSACTLLGLCLFLVWLTIYVCRALVEEAFLKQTPEYRAYMKKTRYRFIPGIC